MLGLSSIIYAYQTQPKKQIASHSVGQTIQSSQTPMNSNTEYKKLEILKQYINEAGRTEFETNITCGSNNNPNVTNLYELHKNAKLKPAEAKYALEALCTMSQAEKFAREIVKSLDLKLSPFPNPNQEPKPKIGDTYESISTGIYYKVTDLKNGFLYGDDMFESRRGPYGENPSLPIDPSAKAYELGKNNPQPITAVRKGAITMPIELRTYVWVSEGGSDVKSTKIIALIVLPDEPEFKWYQPNMINSISPVQTCEGNPQDRCVDGGIDLFPVAQGEDNVNHNFIRPEYPPKENALVMKTITGKLTKIQDTYVKIKSSSGRVFTIKFGNNPVDWFNEYTSEYHNSIKIELGDTIRVRYSEKPDQHGTTIENNHIMNAQFVIEMTSKYDPVKKY